MTLASVLSTYTNSFASGDTIFVDAGTYTNTDVNLTSPKNGVVIKGAGSTLTSFTYSQGDGYFMNVTTNNTTLMNFQVKGYNGDGSTVTEALRIAGTGVQVVGVQVNACGAPQSPTYFYPIEVVSGAVVTFNGGGVTCNIYSEGGGIHLTGSTTNVTIKNYQIIGNSDGTNGVALWVDGSGTVNIYNSRFEYNNGASDEVGSAIYQTGGTVKVYDSYFNANTVNVPDNAVGGAISIAGGTFLMTRSTLKSNVYSGGNGIYGCGIGVTAGTVTIDSCYFSGNLGSRSNDVYVKGGTVNAYNCTFASATNQLGMAGGSFTIANCGNPGKYGTGYTVTNSTAPTYTPAPLLPNYLSESCQSISCSVPATPGAISGTISQCPNLTSQTYSVTAVSGATTYNWSVPAGWTITGGLNTNSITVKTGTTGQNGNITVVAGSFCGQSGTQSLAVTVGNGAPAQPGTISGTTSVCPGVTGQVFSIAAVSGATSYSWVAPTGWSVISGGTTTSATFTAGTYGQNGYIKVKAVNSCGTSLGDSIAVTVKQGTPGQPGAISGTTSVCPGVTGQVFSIAPVSGATSYSWVAPTGWSITSGGTTASATFAAGFYNQNGYIKVKAVNSCGTSLGDSVAVTVNPGAPIQPGTISGLASVCPNVTGTTYSITPLTNASSYSWTLPVGWRVTSGASSNSITVKDSTNAVSGNISVTASNSCGVSSASNYSVTVNSAPPAQPGTISGTTSVCPGVSSQVFSIAAVSGATSYSWVAPAGWSITSGGTTNSATFISGSYNQNGYIKVKAVNSCGTSLGDSVAVTVNPGTPTQPGAISGTNSVCPGVTGQIYSVSSVSGASSYSWSIPNGWNLAGSSVTTNSVTLTAGGSGQNGSISVTASNGCGTSASSSLSVIVYSQPSVNLGSNKSICIGSGVSIGDVLTNGYTYSWSPSYSLNNSSSSTVVASPTSTTTYTLTETNSSGCSQTGSITVNVNSLPIVTAISTRICPGNSIKLTGSGASTYSWSNGVVDGVPFLPQASAIYTLTGTDNNGCQNSATITVVPSDSASPTINVSPQITLPNGSPNTIYVGRGAQTITLTASVDCGIQSYSWSGGSDLSCTNCLTTTVSPTVTTTYLFNYVNASGQAISQSVTIYVVNLGNLCTNCK